MTAVLLFAGFLFFPAVHTLFRNILNVNYPSVLSKYDLYFITERCMNAFHGIMATVLGGLIAYNCQDDIMKDRSWLTLSYTWFGLPYFVYDIWAMYNTHFYQYMEKLSTFTFKARIKDFVRHHITMMIHHIALPAIYFPIILYFRKNLGDYFVGVFYTCEAALPFIAIRFILAHLKLKDTGAYVFFSVLMIVMFFVTRILIFPFLYWKYSQHSGLSIAQVPFYIPIKCNIGCLMILILQVYFFFLMLRGLIRALYKMYTRSQKLG